MVVPKQPLPAHVRATPLIEAFLAEAQPRAQALV